MQLNKHVHDTDDRFKNAYDRYGENPSAMVWNRRKSVVNKEENSTHYALPAGQLATMVASVTDVASNYQKKNGLTPLDIL